MTDDRANIRAAIVMPVYGQADLLCEALTGLLDQPGIEEAAIVLVDDCCPDPRTASKCELYAAAWPGRVFYWRSPENRGLSAMRNEGVRWALDLWPDLQAVTFVDGDDKTFASYIRRGLAALAAHGGQGTGDGGRIGWVYEDWAQFGVPENLYAPAPYQPLFALAGCQHTPGCFVLADVFRDGVWFDEKRRGGDAEDWQFWVKAHANGWRGHHVPDIGFRYRRRTGGLASEGLRAANRNRVLIQREFPALYHPDTFLAEESGMAARHLIFSDPEGASAGPLASDDPRPAYRLDAAGVADCLVRLTQLPTTLAPAHALFFTGGARAALETAGLLDWAAWFTEARESHHVTVLDLTGQGWNEPGLERVPESAPQERSAVISMPLLHLARKISEGATLVGLAADSNCRRARLALTVPPVGDGPSLDAYDALLGRGLAAFDQPGHRWRTEPVWRPQGADRDSLDRLNLAVKAPLSDPTARQASLILVSAEDLRWRSGDLDLPRIAAHFAAQDGTRPSLGIVGTAIPPAACDVGAFRSIFLLPERTGPVDWARNHASEGILAAFGTVVSLDCTAIVPAINAVRRFGCKPVAILPRNDLTASNLTSSLINCFKTFRTLMVRSEKQVDHVLALGVSREIISPELSAQPDS